MAYTVNCTVQRTVHITHYIVCAAHRCTITGMIYSVRSRDARARDAWIERLLEKHLLKVMLAQIGHMFVRLNWVEGENWNSEALAAVACTVWKYVKDKCFPTEVPCFHGRNFTVQLIEIEGQMCDPLTNERQFCPRSTKSTKCLWTFNRFYLNGFSLMINHNASFHIAYGSIFPKL